MYHMKGGPVLLITVYDLSTGGLMRKKRNKTRKKEMKAGSEDVEDGTKKNVLLMFHNKY